MISTVTYIMHVMMYMTIVVAASDKVQSVLQFPSMNRIEHGRSKLCCTAESLVLFCLTMNVNA